MRKNLLLACFCSLFTLIPFAGTASAATPQVAVADASTCFLVDTGALSCQGANDLGQLAQPLTLTESASPLPVSGLPDVRDVEAGDEHFCVLSTSGTVACWGAGTQGQIGNGLGANAISPTTVGGVNGALQISSLDDDVCALLPGGAVKCWGANGGQFGVAYALGDYLSPVDVGGFAGATRIADGDDVLCGLFAGGTVKCQGNNSEGQAGQESSVLTVDIPVPVAGITSAIDISAGEDFTCALIADGTVKCWGNGTDGRLGQGADETNKFSPVVVQGLTGAVKIMLGEEHACALRSDGVVLCWGESSAGQAGQDANFVGTATPVSGLGPAADLFVGYDGACAILAGGGVACWGDNPDGGFGSPAGANVYSARLMPGIDLVTLPQPAASAALTFSGKAKTDRKKKNYTRSAVLTVTPSKFTVLAEACTGTATATTKYKYTTTRKRRGKRVKVKRTKTVRSRANLAVSGATCVANFSLKKLPVKYLNGKRISVTATTTGNAALSAVTATAKTKLTKVKVKKRKR